MKIFLRRLKNKINKVLYSGGEYYCIICNRNYRKFLAAGADRRLNARCPGCGTLERHRLLYYYLKERTNYFTEKISVLDVAPLEMFHLIFSKMKNLNYTSIDLKLAYVTQKADLTKLPFPDESFDCIICYHVMEHIEDDRKALSEMYRVLKKDGWAIIQSPMDNGLEKSIEYDNVKTAEERLIAYGQSDHVRIYGRDFQGKIESAGFKVTKDDYVNKFNEEEKIKYGLDRDEIINICFK